MSASPVSVPDDTEVVPPKSQKQMHRPQRPSMPFPLIDDESTKAPGGGIVVAVLEGDVESFVRKYGTVVERTPGGSEKVENKRLTGIFHQLERGHVYVDESGEAQALVLAQVEVAKGTIRYSDGGFSYNADNKPLG